MSRTPDTVRLPRRTFAALASLIVTAVALLIVIGALSVARANEPLAVANAAEMKVQQAAVERDIQRAYEQATTQVAKVRALNLAISAAQADAIAGKALSDLRALRHSAFVSVGQILKMSAPDAETYAALTEQRFDQQQAGASPSPAPSPVLLAPRLYTIVSRMSELATQLADNATTALTASPSQSPSPSASPSPSRP